MNRYAKIIKITALTIVAGAFLLTVAHYRVGLATWVLASSTAQSSQDHTAHQTASGEKKILYYYDAMNPEHHYEQARESARRHGLGSAVCRGHRRCAE